MTPAKEKPKKILGNVNQETNPIAEKTGINKWFSSNENVLSKVGVYGANIAVNLFSRIHNSATLIGNAYGAIGFGLLDVILRKQKSLRESRGNRLLKTGGSLYYIGVCAYDLVSALDSALEGGNYWANLTELVFDASMAYQLDKDSDILYEKLNSKDDKEEKLGPKDDLKELFGEIKNKINKSLENKVLGTGESGEKKSKRNYLSDFGKSALTSIGDGLGSGYGFGKGAFEKLKENYSVYRTKQKESNELKKIRDGKIKQERAEQKITNALSSGEKVSLKKKKEILEHCGKNTDFMRNYEIENEYVKFKQQPIKEQIQIITEKRNSLKEDFKQMKNASWIKRFSNSSEISDTKSELKKLDKILWELDIEEKNPSRSPAMKTFLKKQEDEKKDGE